MLTFKAFAGINNVQPEHRLDNKDLITGTNVDIGLSGELSRRSGYSTVLGTCHKNLWQASGFMLATVDGNDLSAFATPAGARTVVSPSLGAARVWYVNLPDGRTAFSNGSICGITAGGAATKWGVPKPASVGAVAQVSGGLFSGDYRYLITHVRLSDGLEGAPRHSTMFTLAASSGISLTGLPTLVGHKTNVYLTAHNGNEGFYAGSTTGSTFSYTGASDALVMPCRTEFTIPAPAGICLAFWRGRTLLAVGPVLYASKPGQWEHFDPRRDIKQFSADIKMVVPVDGGIYVGTGNELAFLRGQEFDKLVFEPKVLGPVVLGSGVQAPGELIRRGQGLGDGPATICIAGGGIVAGFNDGGIERMTEGRYETAATQVAATFRKLNGVPQYIAVPQ